MNRNQHKRSFPKFIFFLLTYILVAFSFLSCSSKESHFSLDQLHVDWTLLENQIQPGQRHIAKFAIRNSSKKSLAPDWEIYFNTVFLSVNPEVLGGNVSIQHVAGDLFKIIPLEGFPEIGPDEIIEITYTSDNFLLKNAHAPEGLFIVFPENEIYGAIENYHVSTQDIEDIERLASGTNIPVPTQSFLFEKNSLLSQLPMRELIPVIPTPYSYKMDEGELILQGDLQYWVDTEFEAEMDLFLNLIKPNYQGAIRKGDRESSQLILLKEAEIVGEEEYKLNVNDRVQISAGKSAGAFYGLQSLTALFPETFFSEPSNSIVLNHISIEDKPRFKYRGLFLDVARNFQKKEAVLKLLDLMAFYKLNVFHFNLANDEGWRIEIPELPELTEVGAFRGYSKDESGFMRPYYGSGPDKDHSPFGSGYYSKQDFIDILKYAHQRHIQVIPEIGVPAHSKAAIHAMRSRYHRFMEEGNEGAAREFLLEDFNDESIYLSAQNFRDNTICVCLESVYNFYGKVVDEIMAMYQDANVPLKVFHTGGDEVPHGAWTGSPICKEFIASQEELNSVDDLKDYFYQRVSDMFASKGLQLAGWEEVGQMEVEENGRKVNRPNPTFAEKGFRTYAWNAVAGWGGEDMAYQLANSGYEVVICNSSNFYFDLAYNTDPDEPGHQWSGFVDLHTSWRTVPLNHFISNESDMYGRPIDIDDLLKTKTKPTAAGLNNILGVQGQLWTETVKGQDMMEYYLLPKMLGLVERAWAHEPEWFAEKDHAKRLELRETDWNRFANTVGQKELPRLDHIFGGFAYRLPKPGAIVKDGLLHANVEYPGLIIRFSRSGKDPDDSCPVYTAPTPVEGRVKVRISTPSGKMGEPVWINKN